MIIAGIMNFIVKDKGDETAKHIEEEIMMTKNSPNIFIKKFLIRLFSNRF